MIDAGGSTPDDVCRCAKVTRGRTTASPKKKCTPSRTGNVACQLMRGVRAT
jgi:hypothetical protein